jgi:hypothetical protein
MLGVQIVDAVAAALDGARISPGAPAQLTTTGAGN